MRQALNGNEVYTICKDGKEHWWDNGKCIYCDITSEDAIETEIDIEALANTMHNHIERNGIQIKYGETVLVEVDKLSPLLSDRMAYHLDLSTLSAIPIHEQTADLLPFFVDMTYSAELLSYHNWRNRIISFHASGTKDVYRLHRISYNEFAWIKLEPININDFKATYAVMRKPYEWEQLFGLRVQPDRLKSMGMPREESSMRPINLMEYFQAVGST